MLTADLLKANITTLTPEQIAVIVTLSKNDEDSVIGPRIREIHDQYDRDIEALTGIKKPENTKSYAHLQTVVKDLVEKSKSGEKVTHLETQLNTLKSEKADLEEQIRKGTTDKGLSTKIAQLEQQLTDKTNELQTVKTSLEQEKTDLTTQLQAEKKKGTLLELMADGESYLTKKEVKFLPGIPSTMLEETINLRRNKLIESLTVDQVPDGKGGTRTVFRDKDQKIMVNPENKLEPFSFGELLHKELSDLIDPGKKQPGAGTTGGGGSGSTTILNISSAKTRMDADDIISRHILTKENISKTDPKFAVRQMELRKEHKVEELPSIAKED